MEADAENDDEHGPRSGHAFQLGFINGTPACAAIDEDEVERRRGDLPTALRVDASGNPETRGRNQRRDPLDVDGVDGQDLLAEESAHAVLTSRPAAQTPSPAHRPSSSPSGHQHHRGRPARPGDGQGWPRHGNTACRRAMTRRCRRCRALAVQHNAGRRCRARGPPYGRRLTGVAHRKMAVPIDSPPPASDFVLTCG